MQVPPPIQLDLSAPELVDHLASVPAGAGIYALAVPGHEPHLSWCPNLRTRLRRLLSGRPTQSGGASVTLLNRLITNGAVVQCWPTASRLESALLLHVLARQYFPADYLTKLRLRLPWFIHLLNEGGFPRLSLTNRISRSLDRAAPLFGPFRTRDLAQDYAEKVLGLYQLRRCVDVLIPSPDHPGCIYGEMSQCLRPCQCAVTPEEYSTEAVRVSEFLKTNGRTTANSLSLARDRAAAETDFEQAAYLHRRLERVNETAAARDSVIGEASHLNGLALTRASMPRQFRLWTMLGGYWQEPLNLDFSSEQSRPLSLDRELRETLRDHLANPLDQGNQIENIAIFSRWYYSSWRDGQWFSFRTLGDLNYRKLVREISKLVNADADISIQSKPC